MHCTKMKCICHHCYSLRYPDHEHRIFNCLSLIFPLYHGKPISLFHYFTISYYIETDSPVEIEIVRVVSLTTTEMIDITRFKKKKRSSWSL